MEQAARYLYLLILPPIADLETYMQSALWLQEKSQLDGSQEIYIQEPMNDLEMWMELAVSGARLDGEYMREVKFTSSIPPQALEVILFGVTYDKRLLKQLDYHAEYDPALQSMLSNGEGTPEVAAAEESSNVGSL